MVENIAIVGLYRPFAYDVAKELSAILDMHFFDCIELFEFDNIPRNLSIMLKEFGELHYRKKEVGMLKYVSEFNNTVINLESGMCKKKQNFKTIKSNCLLIYLHQSPAVVEKSLKSQNYNSIEEKRLFKLNKENILKRIDSFTANCDIKVNCTKASAVKTATKVYAAIHDYYKSQKNA